MSMHLLTPGILTNNMWDRYSFSQFTDKNIDLGKSLLKIHAVDRTKAQLFNFKANYKVLV